MTPTARSLAALRKDGWLVAVVEHTIPKTFIKRDLFGMWDLIGIRDGETMAIQVTSGSNVSARVRKIEDNENLSACRKAGWLLVVHGWRKNIKGRWTLRVVDLS